MFALVVQNVNYLDIKMFIKGIAHSQCGKNEHNNNYTLERIILFAKIMLSIIL